jgi:Uma2 family endonuclease
MSTASALSAPAAAPARPRDVVIDGKVRIPAEVVDVESFCRWAVSDQRPARGEVSYLGGLIWVDLTMEELYSHNQVKGEFLRVLANLVRESGAGLVLADGMLIRHTAAALSTEPDVSFVSYAALQSGRVLRREGSLPGIFQLEGSPEMVLEVVSATSVEKDTVLLRQLYWQAGVDEYWLVDVCGDALQFDILRRGPRAYTATRRQAGGWLRSAVFGRSFHLTRGTDPLGNPQFTLGVR